MLNAYENLIPEGTSPSYLIFIETDPHSVDVNIHPTKTEVKFEDEQMLFQLLSASVRETLGRNSFRAGLNFETDKAVPQDGIAWLERSEGITRVTFIDSEKNV